MTKKCSKIISLLMALCILVSFGLPVSGAASNSAAASFSGIRDKMIARETEIPVTIEISLKNLRELYGEDYLNHLNEPITKYFSELFAYVFQHDGTLKGGDYLYKHVGHHGYDIPQFSFDPSADTILLNGVVEMEYYTTAEQETELDDAVQLALEEMNLKGLTTYEKIVRVYGYITANVKYDYKNLEDDSYKLKYSAYAAMVNKSAVCQGYANLFYLFMQHLGIDCRIITGWGFDDEGVGEAHAWNIVKLGEYYYYCDSTWDADGVKTPRFLLRGSSDFERHQSDSQFLTDEFKAAYPIAETRYIQGETPEHKHVPQVVPAVAATCSETGLTEGSVCAVCHEVLVEQTVTEKDLNNHSDYSTEVINIENASCYRDGYSGDTVCVRCRAVLEKGEVIPKETVPHKWDKGEITVKPTCSTEGTMLYRCTVKSCGATMEKPIPKDPDGHVFKVTVYEPTCTDPGYTSHACTLCRYGYSDNETKPLGHEWGDWTELDELQHQRICNSDKTHIEKEDHAWNDGVITTPATVTEEGVRTYTCTVCGAEKTEPVEKNPETHTHDGGEWIVITQPGCVTDGLKELHCTVCGAVLSSEPISPSGHAYGKWIKLNEQQHQRVCANDPSHVEKENHVWNNGEITTPATVTENGIKTYTCTVCGATKTEEIGKVPEVSLYKLGDPDNDGNVTAADARLALRRSVDLEDFAADSPEYIACDVDRSGTVTAADARLILRASVGLEEIV